MMTIDPASDIDATLALAWIVPAAITRPDTHPRALTTIATSLMISTVGEGEFQMRILFIAAFSLIVIGCTPGAVDQPMVGADRDASGCIAAAGYSWCERTRQCERPWELAQSEGFDNSDEAFTQFCEGG